MATIKQKKTLAKLTENHGNISKSMLDAGYSPHTASKPKNLTEAKGWQELMEEYIPDDLLQRIHKEGLEAMRIHGTNDNFIEIIDYMTRHKYLETAYKLKGKLIDKAQVDGTLEVTIKRE